MEKPVLLLFVAISLLSTALAGGGTAASIEYYVSPSGSDSNNGSISAPVATIGKARDLAAAASGAGAGAAVEVYLRAGIYEVSSPVVFSSEHSGKSAADRITFQSYQGERAIISAGKQVPQAAWKKEAPGYYSASLTSLGITIADLGIMITGGLQDCQNNKTELFFNNQAMVLARWPNIAPNGSWAWSHLVKATSDGFIYDDDVPAAKWMNEKDPWLHGYWTQDWSDEYVQITKVDTTAKSISMGEGKVIGKPGGRWLGLNLLSELDVATEYYIDRSDGTLYFWPPSPIVDGANGAFISLSSHAIMMESASHITFKNLEIYHAKLSGLVSTDARDIVIDNCTVALHGANGTVIDGIGNVVKDSTVYETGCMGISVCGGDHITLTRGDNVVSGNTVHHHARWKRTYMPGLFWAGVGNTYANNNISHGPHNCVLGGGNEANQRGANDNLFTGNYIAHCAFETSDTGAFYTCGQENEAWVNRGNKIINNTFVDVRQHTSTRLGYPSVQAIYLDDQMSGWTIENNTFIDCQKGAFVGGGRKNVVASNSFYKCDTAVHLDNRGMNWESSSCKPPNGGDYLAALKYMKIPAWSKYNITVDQPCIPVYNSFADNTYCNVTEFMDVTAADLKAWSSTAINNIEKC